MSGEDSVSSYVDEDADALLDRVDYAGLVGDIGKSSILALFAALTGYVVSIQRNFSRIIDAVDSFIDSVFYALFTNPSEIQAIATGIAANDLEQFDLFALPVGVAVGLATMLAIVLVIYLFRGDGS